jgi:hypothetical protein
MGNALFDMNSPSRGRQDKSQYFVLFALLLILTAGYKTQSEVNDEAAENGSQSECSDGIDNDGDGDIDGADIHCDSIHPEYDGTEAGTGPPNGGGP